jgi:hypothetical protein
MRLTLIAAAAAATLLLGQGALAQTATPGTSSTPGTSPSAGQSAQGQNQQPIRAQIQKNLQSAGFTDIHIMPSSFTVRAKDRDGNPVMMVINPDSVTEVTEMGGASNRNQGSTTGTPTQGAPTTGGATPNGSSGSTGR